MRFISFFSLFLFFSSFAFAVSSNSFYTLESFEFSYIGGRANNTNYILNGFGTFISEETENSQNKVYASMADIVMQTFPFITSCKIIEDNRSYTLLNDLKTDTDCIILKGNFTEINCSSYSVKGKGSGKGMLLNNSNNHTIYNCIVEGFAYGLYLDNSKNNKIFNNKFNNTQNVYLSINTNNFWNTTLTSGENIVGGPYLGGNFWANPSGNGFSETCSSSGNDNPCESSSVSDGKGFCSGTYTISPGNIDYLPLTYFVLNTTNKPKLILKVMSSGNVFYNTDFSYKESKGVGVTSLNTNYLNTSGTSDYVCGYTTDNQPLFLIYSEATKNKIQERINKYIRKGIFFDFKNPSFGYPLDDDYSIKIKIIADNTDFLNSLVLNPGIYKLKIEKGRYKDKKHQIYMSLVEQ